MAAAELTAPQAVALALAAQHLGGGRRRGGDAAARVRQNVALLGAVQLDTISVLARSHELVQYARLGPIARSAVETGLWGGGTFEYWGHAASVIPLELWPWFAARRRRNRVRYQQQESRRPLRAELLQRIRDLGPVTIGDLGGARVGTDWWQWSPTKTAVEELLAMGDVVCTTRRSWRRVYDLPERAIPLELLQQHPTDEECASVLCTHAVRAMGVATVADIADYFRITQHSAAIGIAAAGLRPVTVQGWTSPAYVAPPEDAPAAQSMGNRAVLLSPFDSLIWNRPRTQRMFAFNHRLEAYTPAANRVHGYFTMPLLYRGRLCGRVDPKREGTTLVARTTSVDPGAERPLASALAEAAAWVGAQRVVLERVNPPAAASLISAHLVRLGVA